MTFIPKNYSSVSLQEPPSFLGNPLLDSLTYWATASSFPSTTIGTQAAYEQLIRQIHNLKALPQNWDGYGALPVGRAALDSTIGFVSSPSLAGRGFTAPEVTPNSNGTLSLEWERPEGEAYIEFGNNGASAFVRRKHAQTYYLNGPADALSAALPALMHTILSSSGQSSALPSTKIEFVDSADDADAA